MREAQRPELAAGLTIVSTGANLDALETGPVVLEDGTVVEAYDGPCEDLVTVVERWHIGADGSPDRHEVSVDDAPFVPVLTVSGPPMEADTLEVVDNYGASYSGLADWIPAGGGAP